jgi:hypothetical protein
MEKKDNCHSTINFEQLYEVLFDKLISMKVLTGFYIGKTDNLIKREDDHLKRDGYQFTELLISGNSKLINEAEKFLVDKFLDSELPCMNQRGGGGGNPDATDLYVSYNCDNNKITSIDELNDDDLDLSLITNKVLTR